MAEGGVNGAVLTALVAASREVFLPSVYSMSRERAACLVTIVCRGVRAGGVLLLANDLFLSRLDGIRWPKLCLSLTGETRACAHIKNKQMMRGVWVKGHVCPSGARQETANVAWLDCASPFISQREVTDPFPYPNPTAPCPFFPTFDNLLQALAVALLIRQHQQEPQHCQFAAAIAKILV